MSRVAGILVAAGSLLLAVGGCSGSSGAAQPPRTEIPEPMNSQVVQDGSDVFQLIVADQFQGFKVVRKGQQCVHSVIGVVDSDGDYDAGWFSGSGCGPVAEAVKEGMWNHTWTPDRSVLIVSLPERFLGEDWKVSSNPMPDQILRSEFAVAVEFVNPEGMDVEVTISCACGPLVINYTVTDL